jgi:hypothetical protein
MKLYTMPVAPNPTKVRLYVAEKIAAGSDIAVTGTTGPAAPRARSSRCGVIADKGARVRQNNRSYIGSPKYGFRT